LVVRISKKVAFSYWFVLLVKKLKSVFVRELHNRVLQGPNLLKHLIGNLRVQAYCAMLELVERRVKSLVDVCELLFHTLDFRIILNFALLKAFNFLLDFCKICFSALNVFFGLHQEYLLFFIVLLDSFG
jgi:hypothetical protein